MRFHYSTLTAAILTILTTSHAYAENTKTEKQVALLPIVVEAQQGNEVGKQVYTQEDIKKITNVNKNITDFLRVNPNVQFSTDQSAASSQGELKPAEISINGAQSFQNNFIINGVSNNHLINPAESGGNAYNNFSTGSQGMAINTDLLCQIELRDSNVSAEYGNFTGGVISADTCAPKTEVGELHGTISYDYTSSDWSRFNFLTERESELFEEPSASHQKEFSKQGISANLYGKLSDAWSMNSYASKRESIIPVLSGFDTPYKVDQKRHNDNFGTTLFYEGNENLKAKFGIDYGLLDSMTYTASRRNSGSTLESQSLTTFAEIEQQLDGVKLTHKLNYQNLDSMRDSDNNYGYMWHYSAGSKDWNDSKTVSEGSILGDLNLEQASYSYQLKAALDPITWGKTQHQWIIGSGYEHFDVSWKRHEDVYMSNTSAINIKDLGQQSCLANDALCDATPTIQGWNGQYIAAGTIYKAGEFQSQQDRFHLFVEDQIKWGNFTTRLGVRGDYDSLSGNLNIAPRSTLQYRPFNDQRLRFTSGWNRYYGAQTLGTELQDLVGTLQEKMSRSSTTADWVITPAANSSNTRRSDLDTPYTDERVFAINSEMGIWDVGLKWVHRDFKDEISRTRTDVPNNGFNFSYQYANDGHGASDIYSLSIHNTQPILWGATRNRFSLGVDYSDVFRSYADYNAEFKEDEQERFVMYGGKVIRWSERPATNFNQPWTARASWDIQLTQLPITISNLWMYKAAYDDMLKDAVKVDYNGEKIESYSAQEIKPRFTWDIRTSYDWDLGKNYHAIFGLSINNLTNHRNRYSTGSSSTTTPRIMAEIGRQFMADVSFKF